MGWGQGPGSRHCSENGRTLCLDEVGRGGSGNAGTCPRPWSAGLRPVKEPEAEASRPSVPLSFLVGQPQRTRSLVREGGRGVCV